MSFAEIQRNGIGLVVVNAGLGGGDWAVLAAIIDEELEGEDHTLVVLAEGRGTS